MQDLLGMNQGFKPKFLKKYFSGFETLKGAFNDYHQEVISQNFPSEKESY
jgi:3-methyl-2-oxobutanoate hydroxymethyltransferase